MSNDTTAYPAYSFENMKRFSDGHGFPFPYLLDETQDVARSYGAVCTPDFFGYNSRASCSIMAASIRRGGYQPNPGAKRELFEAMKHLAKTGQGPEDQIPSVGCSLKWR